MRFLSNIAAAGGLVLAAAAAVAETPDATPASDQPASQTGAQRPIPSGRQATEVDRSFVNAAAAGGIFELQAAQIALQNSTTPAVHDFARRMLDDHTTANTRLMKLAGDIDLRAVPVLTGEQDRMINDLRGKHGSDFDRSYADIMVQDHEADVQSFKREANGGSSNDLREFANQQVPILERHLQMAQQMRTAVGQASR